MSTSSEIQRIQTARNTIREKLATMGLAEAEDKIDELAQAIADIANNGDIAGTIDGLTNTSYTVPAGYASGGTVSLTNDIENALAAI